MAKGRIGALSPKTYFPATGDQLEFETAAVWECAKSNTYSIPEEVSDIGVVRYALLLKYAKGDVVAIRCLLSSSEDDRLWLSGARAVHRRIPNRGFRTYDWNGETNTWRQRKD